MHESTHPRRRTAAEMFPLIERYLCDSVTQKSFCEREGLPLSVLHYWLKKYRRQQSPPQTAAPSPAAKRFVPVRFPAACASMPAACEIHFPNGVQARFAHAADAGALLERLQAVAR